MREPVEWLIDNATAYDAVLSAIDGARQSVWISQLAIDADCVAHWSSSSGIGGFGGEERLILDALIDASERRGVDVRILLNASLLVDTAKTLRTALARVGARQVQVRGISRFPQLLHAKMVIVDEAEAFLLGSPFVNGYWDDPAHRPTDSRRPHRELGGRPLHDVSLRITGPAVHELVRIFVALWNDTSTGPAPLGPVRGTATEERGDDGADGLHVVVTIPPRAMSAHPRGRTEILDALTEGIAGAQSLIYIEHQYLSARPIIAALAGALERAPALEIIIVLNQNPDVTAYRGWQNARLKESGLHEHPRVGLFTLWSAERPRTGGDRWALNQVFVHSKVVAVDDAWATVGSANLDGVSLHSYGDDFVGWPGRRVFRDVRNIDANVVVASASGERSSAVHDLRRRLWTEHLGESAGADDSPLGGSLARWRACSARNVAALNGAARGEAAPLPGPTFVLPYSQRPTPIAQLEDVGVRYDPSRLDLRFDPSWLEVHCSPNWIRNMFA